MDHRKIGGIGRIVGVCFAVALATGCGSATSRKASYIAHGQQYLAAGHYDKARVEFSNAAQIDPKDAQVRYLLGQVAEKTGDMRAAAGQYQSAIVNDPKLALARAALGRLYLYGGAAEQAKALVKEGLQDAPRDPGLYTVLAGAEQRLGDKQAALRDAKFALQLAPNDPYAIALMASVYQVQGQSEQAIAVIKSALQRDPRNLQELVILADLYQRSDRPKDSETTLQQIVALAPKDLSQRDRLAAFYVSQKNLDAAEQTLRQAVAIAPTDLGAKLELLSFLLGQRSRDKAGAEAEAMIAQAANNDELRNALAQFLAQAGMAAQAENHFRAVIAHAGTKPQGLLARDSLARLRLQAKDTAGASALIAAVLKENPRDNTALILRSGIESNSGDNVAAIGDLRAVLKDQPNALPVMSALAQAYLRNGEPELAEDVLRNAAQFAPGNAQVRVQLAQTLLGDNKADQAGLLFEQLAKENPTNVVIAEGLFRAEAQQKQPDKARATALAIEKAQPKMGLGFFLAALVDESQGRSDAAEQEYRQALTLDPDAGEPASGLMRLYMRQKKPDQAMQVVQAQITRSPHNGVARVLKGELLEAEGQVNAAITAYQDAISAAPSTSLAYIRLAEAQVKAKYVDDAIRTLQQGVAKTGSLELVGVLGKLYKAQGNVDAAIALYDDLLSKYPTSVFVANNLAVLLINDKSDATSLARAQKLADRLNDSSVADVIDTRGWIKFKSGDFHGAESLLQQAVDKAPEAPLIRYHLAMAQLRSGESQVARQNLETVLQASKPFEGIDQARATLAQLRKASPAG